MTNVKFIKCEVIANRLMIEVFDDKTGKPVTEKKVDMYNNEYVETKETIYRRGDIITLPEDVVKRLGGSIEVVMAPVVMEPVEDEPVEPKEGEFKDTSGGETVADIIPKEPKKSTTRKTTAKK